MISGVSSKNDGKQAKRKNSVKKQTKQKIKAVPNPVDLHVQSTP